MQKYKLSYGAKTGLKPPTSENFSVYPLVNSAENVECTSNVHEFKPNLATLIKAMLYLHYSIPLGASLSMLYVRLFLPLLIQTPPSDNIEMVMTAAEKAIRSFREKRLTISAAPSDPISRMKLVKMAAMYGSAATPAS